MADDNLNEVLETKLDLADEGDEIEEDEEEDEEEEEAPELVREPSTPAVERILRDIAQLSPAEMKEVEKNLKVIIREHTKNKWYTHWCFARDKWKGCEDPRKKQPPQKFAKTDGELGPDVPTYPQWRDWNDPACATYKGDRYSVVDGVLVRKGK